MIADVMASAAKQSLAGMKWSSDRISRKNWHNSSRGVAVRRWHFDKLVAEALDELPRPFRRRLRNIAVVVESEPSRELLEDMGLWPHGTLLGLYQGVPLPRRGFSYGNVLPDRITIFQKPIEAVCRTQDEIKEAVKDTVKHEIGHYFGLDDDRLEELMEE
jgi:predicted Zn-dependent protease with MMP-like domain